MLENLAGHGGLRDAAAAKKVDMRAHAGDAAEREAVADFAESRIDMVFQADAMHLVALSLQGLSDDEWIAAPAGDEADFG